MSVNKKKRTHVGVGLYSLVDAARIVGAHPTRVWRWVNEDELVPRYFSPQEKTLTFAELIEVVFIKMFRDEGVTLPTIRRASQAAAKKFHTDYPFAVKRFDTDGRSIFATLIEQSDDKVVLEDLERGQLCFETVLKPFFRKLEFNGDMEVARYWPKERAGRVVLDPARKFGRPIDSETGVSTRAIYDAFTAGTGQEVNVVADMFGIPVAAVHAAVDFERSLAA
jgi:hypothetical protein